jgi:poly-gamma-glutamate synthesis protein (capsule biosynthesis protein)
MAKAISMKVDLFGDWCPGDKDVEVKHKSKIALVNIEGPIIQKEFDFKENAIKKLGPSLYSKRTPSFSERFIFSISNNHIMDFGLLGVQNTLESLTFKDSLCVGFCSKIHDFHEVSMSLGNNQVLTVIANAEHQFGFASEVTEGYVALSNEAFELIRAAKERGDYVIVSSHGGDEKSFLPSFERRELFRSYIDSGADVVWGHHAHVPQGWEFWKDGLICYGLGNFATDPSLITHDRLGRYSLMVTINLQNVAMSEFRITRQKLIQNRLEIEIFDLPQSVQNSHFSVINTILKSDSHLEQYLDMYSNEMVNKFYSHFVPIKPFRFFARSALLSFISIIKNFGENRYLKSVAMMAKHLQECESHMNMMNFYERRRYAITKRGIRAMKIQHENLEKCEWNLDVAE